MTDDTARWHAVEAIFHDALFVAEPERSTMLTARCGGDTTLMAELRSLLAACEAEEVHRQSVAMDSVLPGASIGHYVIDGLIGRGGMGAVYRAHRADGQFEQQVAIKIIDTPLVSNFFRERFRAERQMLAGLAHPYIARLLDGGVTEADELYLVMEYIDGESISDFCQQSASSIDDRLRLFIKVCEAVQYAHRNLIVHRDLKPENILVTHDSTPRLLDFGTAKIVQPFSIDVAGNATHTNLRTFTPRYASPEQVLDQPISTASDIYSLGVLLYLLLTGQPPYELASFSTEELLRVICNEQPRRPSATSAPFGKIDADLDSIVLKALRKDPKERYSTAESLATDVQAYLDHRPVEARRGNLRYLASKFAKRNKFALAAASLLVVTLLAGIFGVLWQSRRANQERVKAEARAADLRQLSNSLLSELDDALKDIPGSTGAQKLLVTRVLEHLDRMANDSHGDRQTGLDLIDAYTKLGNVQGNIYYQNVADTAGAVASFDRAIAIAEPLAQTAPNDKEVLRAEAAALEARGETLSQSGDPAASAASLQAAVRVYDKVVHLPGVTPQLIFEAAIAYETLGNEMGEDTGMADPQSAMAAYRQAIAMDEQALRLDPKYMAVRRGLPVMYVHLANVDMEIEPWKALDELQTALRLQEGLPADQRSRLQQLRLHALLLRKLAQTYTETGQYSQAKAFLLQSAPVYKRLSDADPSNVGALADLWRVMDIEASLNEIAADPELAAGTVAERKNFSIAALAALQKESDVVRQIIRLSPEHAEWDATLASLLVRQGAVRHALHLPPDAAADTRASLALLVHAAQGPKASAGDLGAAVEAELQAESSSARDTALTVQLAQRAVELTRRRDATYLLLLAKAYRANYQPESAHASAKEGLALLPAAPPGEGESRLHRSLSLEATK
jgi:predicted Ser/Thr protein kinase